MAFCTECGANVPDGVKFCTECGKLMGEAAEAAPAYTAPPPQVPPIYAPQPAPGFQSASAYGTDAPPPKGSKYAVIGTGGYIGTMILFAIPVIGWLVCIITAFAGKNMNRRNFARAMLILLIIGIIIGVALYFVFNWASEVIMEYLNEATEGALGDLGGSGGILDLFKQLGNLPTGE
jgi:hypothetical protein